MRGPYTYIKPHKRIGFGLQLDATWTIWFDRDICMTGVSWGDFYDEIEALTELFGLDRG